MKLKTFNHVSFFCYLLFRIKIKYLLFLAYINTPEINNIKTALLIDRTSKKDIHIHSNLEISSVDCDSVNSKSFNIDLEKVAYRLTHLPGLHWSNITVLKDITFEKAGGNLGRIISHAVNALKNNTISEKVTFEHMSAQKIDLLTSEINGVNIKELYDDAVKNEESDQVECKSYLIGSSFG